MEVNIESRNAECSSQDLDKSEKITNGNRALHDNILVTSNEDYEKCQAEISNKEVNESSDDHCAQRIEDRKEQNGFPTERGEIKYDINEGEDEKGILFSEVKIKCEYIEEAETCKDEEKEYVLPDIDESILQTEVKNEIENNDKLSDEENKEYINNGNDSLHTTQVIKVVEGYGQEHIPVFSLESSSSTKKKLKVSNTYKRDNVHCSKQPVKNKNKSDSLSYKCIMCRRYFKSKRSLTKHLHFHKTNKGHKCNTCGKTFERINGFKNHLLRHRKKNYQCGICKKILASSIWLEKHMIIHSKQKSYTCHDCGKIFSKRDNLIYHLLTHSSVKKHKCSVCGKCFKRSCTLNTHLLIHSIEKKYQCEECKKRFRTKGSLVSHMYTKHK